MVKPRIYPYFVHVTHSLPHSCHSLKIFVMIDNGMANPIIPHISDITLNQQDSTHSNDITPVESPTTSYPLAN